MTQAAAVPELDRADRRRGRASLLAMWLMAGAILLAGLGTPPVRRTQEVRVLETARGLLEAPWSQWLVPIFNGDVRLKKPPLVYWTTAAAFEVGGVNEWAGRLPGALAGWLTIGLTYVIGASLLNRRGGLMAAGMLLCSMMFFRHARLAETDMPAALGATLATWALWRGSVAERWRLWMHLAAVGMVLALMAKGAPAVFPLVFVLFWSGLQRSAEPLRRFWRSGAVLTLTALGAPWFVYVLFYGPAGQLATEMRIIAAPDKPEPFYRYFPQVLVAVLPWSVLTIGAVVHAIRDGRHNATARGLLLWSSAVLVPLMLAGRKQSHYLVPMLPPLMLLTAWLVEQALAPAAAMNLRRAVRVLGWITLALAALIVPGILIMSANERGYVMSIDIALALAATALICYVGWRMVRSLQAGLGTLMVAAALLMPAVLGWWYPTLEEPSIREMGAQISGRYGSGPYCFYGERPSLSLCWALRAQMPQYATPEQVLAAARLKPSLVVLGTGKVKKRPEPLEPPAPFVLEMEFPREGFPLRVYRRAPEPSR